jgi:NAD+ diphosphatase
MAFGGGGLDRAAQLRGDRAALAALRARPGARAVALRGGEPLVEGPPEAPRLARLAAADPRLSGEPLFLGLDGGEGIWASEAEEPGHEAGAGGGTAAGRAWADLRAVMTLLSPWEAEVVATARALLGWHASHGFCARCGAPSLPAQAGWQRDCPACGAHHFPRTDPVVIMLVTRGNAALLGRSPGWPPGMFSCLAGFVEPGETVEAAVRREVWEETGVRVGRVAYVASQPWPFPASLMLGCRAEALSDEIALDPQEIEAALWVSRERMARIAAGRDDAIRAPRPGAIAGTLLRMWLADAFG